MLIKKTNQSKLRILPPTGLVWTPPLLSCEFPAPQHHTSVWLKSARMESGLPPTDFFIPSIKSG